MTAAAVRAVAAWISGPSGIRGRVGDDVHARRGIRAHEHAPRDPGRPDRVRGSPGRHPHLEDLTSALINDKPLMAGDLADTFRDLRSVNAAPLAPQPLAVAVQVPEEADLRAVVDLLVDQGAEDAVAGPQLAPVGLAGNLQVRVG